MAKNGKIGKILNPWSIDHEVYRPNYDVAHLLYIGDIDARFEEPTHCSYWDMLQTKYEDACPPMQGKTRTQSLPAVG